MTPTKEEIGARVDALSQALEGNELIAAVERLADEDEPDERLALQEALLERAAGEDDLQQAVRRRFAGEGLDPADARSGSRASGKTTVRTPLRLRSRPGRTAKRRWSASSSFSARTAAARRSCWMLSPGTQTAACGVGPAAAAGDPRVGANEAHPLADTRPRRRGSVASGLRACQPRPGRRPADAPGPEAQAAPSSPR